MDPELGGILDNIVLASFPRGSHLVRRGHYFITPFSRIRTDNGVSTGNIPSSALHKPQRTGPSHESSRFIDKIELLSMNSGSRGFSRPSTIGPTVDRERYTLVRRIGRGGFSKVYVARMNSTGTEYAIKALKEFESRSDEEKERIEREIRNQRLLNHPNVVSSKEHFVIGDTLYIVMVYSGGETLKKHVDDQEGLTENWSRWFFQQLVLALDYLHEEGVVHRDVKPANIFTTTTGAIVLGDFGFSKSSVLDSAPDTWLGTPPFIAPEILELALSNDTRSYNGEPVDVFALGVSLFYMLYWRLPLRRNRGAPRTAFIRSILHRLRHGGNVEIPRLGARGEELSSDVRDLLKRMLEVNPRKRITIKKIMQSTWFRDMLPEEWYRDNQRAAMEVEQASSGCLFVVGKHIKKSFEALQALRTREEKTNFQRISTPQ